MELSQQVVSLELSKRLKELGVAQNGLFFYQNNPYNDGTPCMDLMIKERHSINSENVILNSECENDKNPSFSAFTVAELGEMLSRNLIVDNKEYLLTITKGWHISYEPYINNYCALTEIISDENEANVRAKMLIYLIENNLITNKT